MRHIKRRIVMLLLLGAVIWSCNRDNRGDILVINPSYLPHESNAHKKTWISFYTDSTLLNASQINEVKHNLILVITTIAQYEPVSILVKNTEYKELLALLGNLDSHHYPIQIIESEMELLWMRDEGPTFVWDTKDYRSGINFNFRNSKEEQNSTIPDFVTTQAGAKIIHSNLKVTAGCFEVDGAGTAIITESCIINDDANPYWNKEEIEIELKLLLGLQKIIWLKGNEEEGSTNSQTDSYARFVKEGLVLVHRNNDEHTEAYTRTRENIKILKAATDAKGKPLEIVIIDAPSSTDQTDKSYLGYYLCNRALIMQSFGDEQSDYKAKQTLQLAFSHRTIEQLRIDAFPSFGGNIHRITQQEITH